MEVRYNLKRGATHIGLKQQQTLLNQWEFLLSLENTDPFLPQFNWQYSRGQLFGEGNAVAINVKGYAVL